MAWFLNSLMALKPNALGPMPFEACSPCRGAGPRCHEFPEDIAALVPFEGVLEAGSTMLKQLTSYFGGSFWRPSFIHIYICMHTYILLQWDMLFNPKSLGICLLMFAAVCSRRLRAKSPQTLDPNEYWTRCCCRGLFGL